MRLRSRRTAATAGLLALLAILVGSVLLVVPFVSSRLLNPGAGSAGSTRQTPCHWQMPTMPPESASPGSAYFDDGIPRTFDGEPVIRGLTILRAARASCDDTPFYIAFWVGQAWQHSCPLMSDDDIFGCGGMDNVGDQPGVLWSPLSSRLMVRSAYGVAVAKAIATHAAGPGAHHRSGSRPRTEGRARLHARNGLRAQDGGRRGLERRPPHRSAPQYR